MHDGGDEVFFNLVFSLLSMQRFFSLHQWWGDLWGCLFIGLACYLSVHLVIFIVHRRRRPESSCLHCDHWGVLFPHVKAQDRSTVPNHAKIKVALSGWQQLCCSSYNLLTGRERAIIAMGKNRQVDIGRGEKSCEIKYQILKIRFRSAKVNSAWVNYLLFLLQFDHLFLGGTYWWYKRDCCLLILVRSSNNNITYS